MSITFEDLYDCIEDCIDHSQWKHGYVMISDDLKYNFRLYADHSTIDLVESSVAIATFVFDIAFNTVRLIKVDNGIADFVGSNNCISDDTEIDKNSILWEVAFGERGYEICEILKDWTTVKVAEIEKRKADEERFSVTDKKVRLSFLKDEIGILIARLKRINSCYTRNSGSLVATNAETENDIESICLLIRKDCKEIEELMSVLGDEVVDADDLCILISDLRERINENLKEVEKSREFLGIQQC
jgi:hypothetical protein